MLHHPRARHNPFFAHGAVIFAYWPVLVLATAAAVIASQAVITGAFSMTQQAVQLGLLPRMDIRRTSETQAGQIFVPAVNRFLMLGVLMLLVVFQTSAQPGLGLWPGGDRHHVHRPPCWPMWSRGGCGSGRCGAPAALLIAPRRRATPVFIVVQPAEDRRKAPGCRWRSASAW